MIRDEGRAFQIKKHYRGMHRGRNTGSILREDVQFSKAGMQESVGKMKLMGDEAEKGSRL